MEKNTLSLLLLLTLLLLSPLCLAQAQPSVSVPAPVGAKLLDIETSNGFTFTHYLLKNGTYCVHIEKDMGSLAQWSTMQCDFTHTRLPPAKKPLPR